MGGSAGFSRGRAVSWIRARLGLADSKQPAGPPGPGYRGSRPGWAGGSCRCGSTTAPSVSRRTADRHSASMGMGHPPLPSWFQRVY